ncbi:Uncharacterised protein [Mycobacterium xenopi]|uniref:Uncharacterized protein n=1 Tax=Mycobacterium xenopi TaxID=1789 RepID=A0AAD1GXF4_MYCXE|nr:hypothetical protein MYXE_02490 [Mycobacterium xenopi]SPX79626.1 Uncharacterised protein [Mycobacterium xenopi]
MPWRADAQSPDFGTKSGIVRLFALNRDQRVLALNVLNLLVPQQV